MLGGDLGNNPVFGDRAEYTCAIGYYLECLVDDEWTSDTSLCLGDYALLFKTTYYDLHLICIDMYMIHD